MITKNYFNKFPLIIILLFMTLPNISAQEIQFSIGDTWTYERFNEITNRISFEEIRLTDTLTIDDRSCYVMDRGTFMITY